MMILSIDIGGTYLKYALIDADFGIIKKWKKSSLSFETKDAFYDYVCQNINTTEFITIGVSSAGVIDERGNVLSRASANISIMHETNINEEIGLRLKCPVVSINDARAAGLCEVKMGNGKNSLSSVYCIIGTGIGGAIFWQDQLFRGANNIAGEFSHLPTHIVAGKTKGISNEASISALIKIYQKVSGEEKLLTGKEICESYLNHDNLAIIAVEEWLLNVVNLLHVLIICYDPEIICIGGAISEADWFINRIKTIFYQEVTNRLSHLMTTKIDRCRFNNDANLIGAALFAAKKG